MIGKWLRYLTNRHRFFSFQHRKRGKPLFDISSLWLTCSGFFQSFSYFWRKHNVTCDFLAWIFWSSEISSSCGSYYCHWNTMPISMIDFVPPQTIEIRSSLDPIDFYFLSFFSRFGSFWMSQWIVVLFHFFFTISRCVQSRHGCQHLLRSFDRFIGVTVPRNPRWCLRRWRTNAFH